MLIKYYSTQCSDYLSAILASAALPGFVKAIRLEIKDEDVVVQDQRKSETMKLAITMDTAVLERGWWICST